MRAEGGFFFCGFNNAYQLNPATFQIWIRILREVEDSVVWLSDPQRLVFATRVASTADHLARHRMADLFLGALPYNAHTTASYGSLSRPAAVDAGRRSVRRTGGGQPAAYSRDEYKERAIALALDREKLRGIRERWNSGVSRHPCSIRS
ncbi:hypothetical protein [Bradyrhizobium liaoningense]|uniref:O-linked N-acetylglucosamine transferase family protein n=1 Tax=Bradyrhizobium liaoningense TaxID=43992 RepID=UPI0039088D75